MGFLANSVSIISKMYLKLFTDPTEALRLYLILDSYLNIFSSQLSTCESFWKLEILFGNKFPWLRSRRTNWTNLWFFYLKFWATFDGFHHNGISAYFNWLESYVISDHVIWIVMRLKLETLIKQIFMPRHWHEIFSCDNVTVIDNLQYL